MSKTIPPFRVTIVGESFEELKDRMIEFLTAGTNLKIPMIPKEEQEDFLTQAASQPSSEHTKPSVTSAPHPVPSGSSTDNGLPSPAIPSNGLKTNDYGVDSRGLPWDERVHSSSQGKNATGSWRYKRNVEKNYIAQVEQELASRVKIDQGARMESVPQVPATPPTPLTVVPPPMAFPPTPVAPVQAPPPLPPPQIVPAAHSLVTFKQTLVPTLAKLVTDGKLNQAYIKTLCDHYQVPMLHMVNDEQLAELFESFVQYKMIVRAE
jgi:hypothetical protein